MRVAVLGCGPAGLMAAHGAVLGGADEVEIFSKYRKSEMFGAQYLHRPIPGTPVQQAFRVEYLLEGSALTYRDKVYGRDWDGRVSPEDLVGDHDGWDIRATYDWLWMEYHNLIIDMDVNPSVAGRLGMSFDMVISTIPKPLLCIRGHQFRSTDIYAAGDAPERGVRIPYTAPMNTVVCNGDRDVAWYRLSNIQSYKTVEWPGDLKVAPPLSGVAQVKKPLDNNCDCFPLVVHAGRYGEWKKGILSHSAYETAHRHVMKMRMAEV